MKKILFAFVGQTRTFEKTYQNIFDKFVKFWMNFVVLIGDEELKTQTYTLKTMTSGEQTKCMLSEMIDLLRV